MCGPSPIFHFWQWERVGEEHWVWADCDALESPTQALTEMELLNELKFPHRPLLQPQNWCLSGQHPCLWLLSPSNVCLDQSPLLWYNMANLVVYCPQTWSCCCQPWRCPRCLWWRGLEQTSLVEEACYDSKCLLQWVSQLNLGIVMHYRHCNCSYRCSDFQKRFPYVL